MSPELFLTLIMVLTTLIIIRIVVISLIDTAAIRKILNLRCNNIDPKEGFIDAELEQELHNMLFKIPKSKGIVIRILSLHKWKFEHFYPTLKKDVFDARNVD